MAEVLPGFVALTWFGVVAPPLTPASIVNRVSVATVEALQQPEVAKRLRGMTVDAVGNTPAEMAQFMREERQRWANVISFAGVKAD